MRNVFVALLFLTWVLPAHAQSDALEVIRDFRLQGLLEVAMQLAEEQLEDADPRYALELNLELAKIHDRIGLHTNTRPVAAALQHIRTADRLAARLDDEARAEVSLAYAEYFYRAEMGDRRFEQATRYAEQALEAFQPLEDFHGQADAVHRLGLIRLQRRDLDQAKVLFEESLRLDRIDGERGLLRADYERHVAFVYALREEYAEALPYFERSLAVREQMGAIDPAMFAAISLASRLVELDRAEDALPHLEYAAGIAESIDSKAGRSRVQAIVDRLPNDLRSSTD